MARTRDIMASDAMTRAANGSSADEIAVDLSNRFWKRLCIFAARRLRDRSAAEDVAQETLRRALQALRQQRVENLEALPAFIFQTARNICLHYGRSARREEGALLRFRAGMQSSSGEESDPLIALVDEARREGVRSAIEHMPPDDRDLLRMLYIDGLESSDIARRLGVDPGTLRVRKHRALKRLSELIGNVSP
ncbi:MAG TPA: sigma-70 family RNA polymerase sigma factor [Thermoanaerobaculia bacterium]|nr:sigma-70 family RNA polymerase sigma factor [Thermoanaerobaculia bacterium]